MAEGILSDYRSIRPKGMKIAGIASSGDRIVGVTIQADSLGEFNRKHRLFVDRAKAINTQGNNSIAMTHFRI